MNPSRCWRAGETRTAPDGTPLEGNFTDSFWVATLTEGRWSEEALPDIISDLVNRLAANKKPFHQYRAEGGRVELFVGWFLDGQSRDVFNCDLLGRLAELEIDLALDIYPPDQSEGFRQQRQNMHD